MSTESTRPTHCTATVARAPVLLACVATLGLSVLLCGAAAALLGALHRPDGLRTAQPAISAGTAAGAVRVDLIATSRAGEHLREQQRSRLQRFEWVDRERGVIRVPIDLAIELELQEAR